MVQMTCLVKKIGVQLGTTGDIYVSDYETDGSNTIVERYNKGSDAIQALKQGKIDAVVIDSEPAKAYVAANRGLKILDEEFIKEDLQYAYQKNNTDLTASFNEALGALKENGTLTDIINNYIGDSAGKTPYSSPENATHDKGTLLLWQQMLILHLTSIMITAKLQALMLTLQPQSVIT